MKRRKLIALVGSAAIAGPTAARAQKRLPRVVYLWLGAAGSDGESLKGFQAGLREFRYQEGRNLIVDYRYADGSEGRLAELAAAAIAERPDLIYTLGTGVTGTVAKLTRTIPIVSVTGDPVGSGFAKSLARPGGNITGMANTTGPELVEKWVELLSEITPRARRIAMLRKRAEHFQRRPAEQDAGGSGSARKRDSHR
jgi:putative ABC transport system substrate-binding protein